MHVIEGLMITEPLENTLLHASICVSPWGVFVQAMYISSYSSSEGGILQASRSPAERPPSGYLPPTRSPFIPPSSLGLQWDRTPAAVLTAPWTISHNWHHAIITSHQSNPCLPLLMSDSGPTRPALSHICHSCTHTHTHTCVHMLAEKKKKKLSCGERRIPNHGCFKGWCSTAVSINAFNLSNPCCLGGRGDSNGSWH